MKRLCRDSSRPYLGRSASRATPLSQQRSGSTARGNTERVKQKSAEGIVTAGQAKASEALQGRKVESTDRPRRNAPPRRPELEEPAIELRRAFRDVEPERGSRQGP